MAGTSVPKLVRKSASQVSAKEPVIHILSLSLSERRLCCCCCGRDVENPLFAVITLGAFKWLMGDMELKQGETKDQLTKPAHQVFIKRCRFVEEAGCASVCVNSCKVPTQAWLREDFGVDLRVTPDYEDFSCKFEFGQVPLPEEVGGETSILMATATRIYVCTYW